MTYEPTQWKAGDTVTSAKLNKLEQGVASNNVVEGVMENNIITLNKTWQQIWDNNYTNIIIINNSLKTFSSITGLQNREGKTPQYILIADAPGSETSVVFTCNSPDAYPSYTESSSSGGADTYPNY